MTPASTKTVEQRKTELAALMATSIKSRVDSPSGEAMPKEAEALVDMVNGLTFGDLRNMAKLDGDVIPLSTSWRSFRMGKNKDVTGWGCGDGFNGRQVIVKDGYAISMKLNVTMYRVG